MGFSAAVARQEVIGRVKMTNALRFSFSLAVPCTCVFLKFSHDPFCCTPNIPATPWAATTAGNLKRLIAIGLRQVKSGVFVVNLWNFSVLPKLFRSKITYLRVHLSVDTRQNKTCSYRVTDMTCFAAKHLKFVRL